MTTATTIPFSPRRSKLTNAERQRRYRERKRNAELRKREDKRNGVTRNAKPYLPKNQAITTAAEAAAAVVIPDTVITPATQEAFMADVVKFPGKPNEVAEPKRRRVPIGASQLPRRPVAHTVILVVAALGLATVSAMYSITGLTSIFIGAFWSVVALGIVLEIGKLSAVSALPSLRAGPLKMALVGLVLVLMGLNALGAYGYLSKAQLAHSITSDASIEAQETQARARLEVQAALVADLDKRINQVDRVVEEATRRGRTKNAVTLAADQKQTRDGLVRERQWRAEELAELKAQEAMVTVHRRIAAADLGPVRYLAELLGVPADSVLRWFILLVACLLDPAAVLLLLVASRRPA